MALSAPAIPVPWRRRLRIVVVALAAFLAIFALVGFFAVPPIAKSKIEALARTELGRGATVGKVELNPFTLRARIRDFALADRDPQRTLLRFELLEVDVSSASIWKRAPLLDAVRLVKPQVEIAIDAKGEYNIQDLVDRAAAPSTGPEATFAVNNIEIEDGAVVLDDAVHGRRIAVTKLDVGIPFLSSFERDAQIRVTPRLQGAIDGAPFALTGTATSPFEDTQQATLQINLDALALSPYVAYAPLPGGMRLTEAALTTRLSLAFIMGKGTARGIALTGNARVDRLAVTRKDASPVIAAKSVEVVLGKLDVTGRSVAVERIVVDAPAMDLRRMRDGALEVQQLLAARAARAPATAPAPAPAEAARAPSPWTWTVAEARLAGGMLDFTDESVSPAFRTRLSGLTIHGAKLASGGPPGTVEAAFDTEDGAHFAARSEIDIGASAARGRFDVARLPIAKLKPYYAGLLALDVRRGTLALGADFDAGTAPATRFTLAQGSAAIDGLDVAVRGEREALWRMARAGVEGLTLDLAKRTVTIDKVEARQGMFRVLREAGGAMHFEKVLHAGDAAARPPETRKAGDGPEWRVMVHRLLVERLGIDVEDRVPDPAVRLKVTDARIAADNLDTAHGAKARVDVSARIGSSGRVRVNGTAGARPAMADLRVTATALDLVPVRPYLESRTNVIVTSGAAAAKGRVTYGETEAGAAVRYVGDVVVSDFGSLDRPGSQELLRWKTLALTGMDVTSAPFNLALASIALDQFYARLILSADAKLNVMQLLAQQVPEPSSAPAFPAPAAPAAPAVTKTASTAAPSAPAAERQEIPAAIGEIRLSGGEVEYSDFFVQPNYSVHLTSLAGRVSELSTATAGAVEIGARVDGSAPVDIRGTLNPFAKELALDIHAKATDVDLPPLTPYSVKYAGYGIQKGKLTMEVHYKLDNRKLAATNKLKLDQLTFGERVESPTATKLPVLFAVNLLKDRNGVINLDLPIQGTLDDPQFSVWRVVVQIIVNLLTKAMTAPFALLGALAGGGEQLSFIEFAPGSTELTPAALGKLATLAKALGDRPGLKLDAAGRASAEADSTALRRAALDQALRVQKQKDLARNGASAPALEAIVLDAADRTKYLKAVYKDADLKDKPRNFIGMAKDIPAEQMEAMLLASYRIDDEALRNLASHRAQAVQEWLAAKGDIPRERVFVVAPRLGAQGLEAGAVPARVDFAIK